MAAPGWIRLPPVSPGADLRVRRHRVGGLHHSLPQTGQRVQATEPMFNVCYWAAVLQLHVMSIGFPYLYISRGKSDFEIISFDVTQLLMLNFVKVGRVAAPSASAGTRPHDILEILTFLFTMQRF